ncbi:unnamed protein product [Cladocopium goreaui]|uniref:E3 ubiquitin-protein ligase RNF217 n=1 Tax=Cladocopium goreaui TaxID=2562237 RepID=A0A9P1BH07_9DINO|nr:unnamed protein product [Cladocopium goreaui]
MVRKLVALSGWRRSSWRFEGWKDCYLAFNDPPGELLHIILSLVRWGRSADAFNVEQLVSVAGSLTAVNLLMVLPQVKHIHFFDMNPCAIAWGKMLIELIKASRSPQHFISQLFARDVLTFEEQQGFPLRCSNQQEYLQQPISRTLRDKAQGAMSAGSADVYGRILMPYQEGVVQWGWHTPRLQPCEDRKQLTTCTRSGLGSQGRLPEDGVGSYQYGEGWLSSQWTFDQVRGKLLKTPVSWCAGVDFSTAAPEQIAPQGKNALLFLQDMFSSEFASSWPMATARSLAHRHRLLLAQSITADKGQLLQELRGDSWHSWSDWDSQALLPSELCGCCPGCRPPGLSGEMLWRCHPLLRAGHQEHQRRLLEELTGPRLALEKSGAVLVAFAFAMRVQCPCSWISLGRGPNVWVQIIRMSVKYEIV